jgi:hypothetical protein
MRLALGPVAALALALPAVAQDADYGSMTCADFATLDEAGMMAAAEGLQALMTSGGDTSANPVGETTADSNESAEEVDGTMAAGGASDAPAATDDMASADAAAGGASTDMATADATSGDTGSAATTDPMMTALVDACVANPGMTLTDAMAAAQGGTGAGGTATN